MTSKPKCYRCKDTRRVLNVPPDASNRYMTSVPCPDCVPIFERFAAEIRSHTDLSPALQDRLVLMIHLAMKDAYDCGKANKRLPVKRDAA